MYLVPCFPQRNTVSLKPNPLLDFTVFFCIQKLRVFQPMFHCHGSHWKAGFFPPAKGVHHPTQQSWIKTGLRIRLCCGCFLISMYWDPHIIDPFWAWRLPFSSIFPSSLPISVRRKMPFNFAITFFPIILDLRIPADSLRTLSSMSCACLWHMSSSKLLMRELREDEEPWPPWLLWLHAPGARVGARACCITCQAASPNHAQNISRWWGLSCVVKNWPKTHKILKFMASIMWSSMICRWILGPQCSKPIYHMRPMNADPKIVTCDPE